MNNEARFFSHGQLPGALELALVGDSLYDLYVRKKLVLQGGRVRDIHAKAVKFVNAHAQSEALKQIENELTDEEAGVVRRARNTRQTPTGHSDASEYRRATSLEALLGYLYLTEQSERLEYLLGKLIQIEGQAENNG